MDLTNVINICFTIFKRRSYYVLPECNRQPNLNPRLIKFSCLFVFVFVLFLFNICLKIEDHTKKIAVFNCLVVTTPHPFPLSDFDGLRYYRVRWYLTFFQQNDHKEYLKDWSRCSSVLEGPRKICKGDCNHNLLFRWFLWLTGMQQLINLDYPPSPTTPKQNMYVFFRFTVSEDLSVPER